MEHMNVYTALVRLGMDDEAAGEIADVVRRTKQDLATKEDLAALVTKEEFAGLRREFGGLRQEFAELRHDMARMEVRLTRTVMTTMIAMTGIFAAFVGAMAWVVDK
jgi:hypothetical protein